MLEKNKSNISYLKNMFWINELRLAISGVINRKKKQTLSLSKPSMMYGFPIPRWLN